MTAAIGGFTLQELKSCIKKWDLINRPYEFYCHPDNKEWLQSIVGDNQIIRSNYWLKNDQIIVVDRKKVEEMKQEWLAGFADVRSIVDQKGINNES